MTWEVSPLPPFRFSRKHDVGITIYLILVSIWFLLQISPLILAPVFFADPAGAVVGKWFSRNIPKFNPAWYEKKTILGTLAVVSLTFATITFDCSMTERIIISIAAGIAEAIGGDYDNLFLAAVVLSGW